MKAQTVINYELTEQEQKDAQEFIDKHLECRRHHASAEVGAIRSTPISYCIGSNSVADTIIIRCDFCRKQRDISDVSVW